MRGRKRIPTVIKLARGNPRADRLNLDEPETLEMSADCPIELQADEAKAEWHRTIVPAIGTGQITAGDRSYAVAHCHYWSIWLAQIKAAAELPDIVPTNRGGKCNPIRKMSNETFLLLAKVDAELGLTPCSRSRVKAHKPVNQTTSLNKYLSAIPGGKTGT
jgi:phage terminase small subunit